MSQDHNVYTNGEASKMACFLVPSLVDKNVFFILRVTQQVIAALSS